MELHLASTFIRIIAENAPRYPIATQQALLQGIFQLTDECQEQLERTAGDQRFENVAISLDLVKCIVNESLKHTNLADAFRLADEVFPPEAALPPAIL